MRTERRKTKVRINRVVGNHDHRLPGDLRRLVSQPREGAQLNACGCLVQLAEPGKRTCLAPLLGPLLTTMHAPGRFWIRRKKRIISDPRRAPEQDRRTSAIGAPLPAWLALAHEVVNPVDQTLKHVLPKEGTVPVLRAEWDVEAEVLREGVFGIYA